MQKPIIALVIGGAGLLTACQSLSPEAVRQRDEQRCQLSYGFKPGTDGMAQCLQNIDLDRRAESREMQARMQRDLMYRPVYIERRVIIERR